MLVLGKKCIQMVPISFQFWRFPVLWLPILFKSVLFWEYFQPVRSQPALSFGRAVPELCRVLCGARMWQRVWAAVGAAGVRARLRALPHVVVPGQSQDLCLLLSFLPSQLLCPLPAPNGAWGSPASFSCRRNPCTSWCFLHGVLVCLQVRAGALAPQGSCDPPGVPVPPPPACSSSRQHVGWEMHPG